MSWQARAAAAAALLLAVAHPLTAQTPVAEEFDRLHFRSIGPATMSGRISDVAVYEANPTVYYVGTAHGGVWKTTNAGTTWEPQFQHEGLISIGDVAVSQRNPDLVWAGAGESNNRQSTSWGGGVWKSTDGGATFTHMGLPNSRHINRIILDPANDDVVLVAATGPLFGPGGDRGIYKSRDGGRTWTHALRTDEDTGANELVFAPTNPQVMYASTYQRRRNACCMNGGGPGSGIWKSTDGGDTWSRLSGGGLPDGPLGRIAIDVFRGDANIVYATIEGPSVSPAAAAAAAAVEEEESPSASAARPARQQQESVTGVYRSLDGGTTWEKVNSANPRPMYFSKIRIDPTAASGIYMGGVGLHMSIDSARTFHTDAALVTHDDLHALWINPANPEHILIGNDGGLAVSYDRSRTWQFIPNLPVGLFYHVSYDMERPFNVCGGMQDNYNWCGPSASRHARGIMNYDWFQIQGGDGFHAIPDLRDSRIIYTESQNGNMIRRNKVTGESKQIRPTALNVVNADSGESYRWNWDSPMMLSPHDPGVLLVAAQRVFRSTDRGDSWTAISPDLTTDAERDTIATMGVKNTEIRIARNDGISNWPTIVSLAESPRQAGLLYTGTDDGVVSVTRDGGRTWENVTARLPGFPAGAYVSEVAPSAFDAGTVYVTVDNHLNNDYETYMWASNDFGATFRSIRGNLRGQNVRTLTEDRRNPDVLYIGTETGMFVSLDRGASWRRVRANLPTVRVDEITIHPRDNAMIVATHGRALWILDNLQPVQEYTAAQRDNADATLFSIPTALQRKLKDDRNEEFWGHQWFAGENPPAEAVVQYHLKRPANEVRLVITDAAGRRVREVTAPANRLQPGIQTLCWDQRVEPIASPPGQGAGGAAGPGGGRGGQRQATIPGVPTPLPLPGYRSRNICAENDSVGAQFSGGGGFGGGATAGPYVEPGTYQVALMVDGHSVVTKPLTIVMDPEVQMTAAERARYNDLAEELHEAHRRGSVTANALTALGRQIAAATAKADSLGNVPADARAQLDALKAEFDRVRVKFGVNVPGAAGGGGGGGGGGGAPNAANALGRVTSVKSGVLGVWEPPSDAVVRQANDARAALAAAIAEADALLARVPAVSAVLARHGVTLEPRR